MKRIEFLAVVAIALLLPPLSTALAQQQEMRVALQTAEPGVVQTDGQLRGQNVDIWEAIAKDAAFRVSFLLFKNNTVAMAAMDEGKADVVGGTTQSAANRDSYRWSSPYAMTAEGLVVPKTDMKEYRSIADATGLNFATIPGTTYAPFLRQSSVSAVTEYESTNEALKAVSNGQATAALFAGTIAGFSLKQGLFPNLKMVESYQPKLARPVVMAFRKDAGEKYTKTNASIEKLVSDGTLKGIYAKYGNIWLAPPKN